MALIRILLILLLLGAGTILVWQNQGPFIITLLGTKMQLLPLGVLLLLSILLGIGVGILLLFLLRRKAPANAFRRASTRKSKATTKAKNPFKSLFQSNPFQSNSSRSNSSQAKKTRPQSSYSRQYRTSDWYETPAKDWAGVPPSRSSNESASRSPRESYRDDEQDPYPNRAADFDESPDSFARSRKESPRERVVDADYRVLRQPNAPPPSDEDWDDDFFREDR